MTVYRIHCHLVFGIPVYHIYRILAGKREEYPIVSCSSLLDAKAMVQKWLSMEKNLEKFVDIANEDDLKQICSVFKE